MCYDANGIITSDSFHTYQWDSEGHPIVIGGASGTGNQTYNVFGNMAEGSVPAYNYTAQSLYDSLGCIPICWKCWLVRDYLPLGVARATSKDGASPPQRLVALACLAVPRAKGSWDQPIDVEVELRADIHKSIRYRRH